jgi:hypothetical protein
MPHRYVVRRMTDARRMLLRWQEQDRHYVSRVDDALFARSSHVSRKHLVPSSGPTGAESGDARKQNARHAQAS